MRFASDLGAGVWSCAVLAVSDAVDAHDEAVVRRRR